MHYLRITLSNKARRLVPLEKIYWHAATETGLSTEIVKAQMTQFPELILEQTKKMKWLDAFPCRCMGGLVLDWDKEWQESEKEII